MSNCSFNLFPTKCNSNRSQQLTVKCGEYLTVEGYCMPEDVCIKVWKVDEDKCKCDYFEKPFCINGSQLGMDEHCTTTLLTMPGCYVAYICGDMDCLGEDFKVRVERVKCLDNLAVTFQGAAIGA